MISCKENKLVTIKEYKKKKVSIGDTVGWLTILKEGSDIISPSGQKVKTFICSCICGNVKTVRKGSLYTGNTRSCGCYKKAESVVGEHGMSHTKEYNAWVNMRARCMVISNTYYKDYGGRGIAVCERWVNSFENFLEDMGHVPEGKSLDRINVDGNYCKENCQWSTLENQSFNRRILGSNKSGRTGVFWLERLSKYQVSIRHEGKLKYLGVYSSFEQACKARKDAEITFYGIAKDE